MLLLFKARLFFINIDFNKFVFWFLTEKIEYNIMIDLE